jgi:histidinol dehydrogenase
VKTLRWEGDPEAVVSELRALAPPPAQVRDVVAGIVADVRARGDAAVREATARLDGVSLPADYALDPAALARALHETAVELRAALELAADNVRAYHERERPKPWRRTLPQGQVIGQEIVPVSTAGLYVPGGLADYPSSALMTVVPAQVAGVGRVVVCSPPRPDGGVAPGVAAACALLGVEDVVPIGGAQAVAAMALGTEVVPRCDVVAGPGNAYVTETKRQLVGEVGIDGLAGPSEVLVVAGPGADPEWLAADLLAQAEHGAGATACLADVGGALSEAVEEAVVRLGRELGVAHDRLVVAVCPDLEAALDLCNAYAPEHLELHLDGADELLPRVRNAGAVFVGPFAATAFADYAAGTNHVLPTGGAARFGQGLSVAHFLKRVAVVQLDRAAAAALAAPVARLAHEEGLRAHAASVSLRSREAGAGGHEES